MEDLSFKELKDKVCVITGGGGVLGNAMARGLASVGVRTVILDINEEGAKKTASDIASEFGVPSFGYKANVLEKQSLEDVLQQINAEVGEVDMLINGAGGNSPQATTKLEELTENDLSNLEDGFFGLEAEGFQKVFSLNFTGTLLTTMVFSRGMVKRQRGVVLNVSSMTAYNPLTKVPAYSAAKAAVSNFTQWLAVHMAQEYSQNIRVNAIAPGFFLTNQNLIHNTTLFFIYLTVVINNFFPQEW